MFLNCWRVDGFSHSFFHKWRTLFRILSIFLCQWRSCLNSDTWYSMGKKAELQSGGAGERGKKEERIVFWSFPGKTDTLFIPRSSPAPGRRRRNATCLYTEICQRYSSWTLPTWLLLHQDEILGGGFPSEQDENKIKKKNTKPNNKGRNRNRIQVEIFLAMWALSDVSHLSPRKCNLGWSVLKKNAWKSLHKLCSAFIYTHFTLTHYTSSWGSPGYA